MVEAGPRVRRAAGVDSIVGLGGGSSLDCAKGINFLLTNGGSDGGLPRLRQGDDAAAADDRRADDGRDRQRGAELRRHLRRRDAHEDGVRRPVGGVPHRAARSRADADARRASVTAMAGFDAIAHAVETAVTVAPHAALGHASRTRRGGCSATPSSACCSRRPTSKRARRCSSARTSPAWRSSSRCSAPRTPARTR